MNNTTTTTTYRTFDEMADDYEFAGFGYIGGREYLTTKARAAADAFVVAHAIGSGWTDEDLFAWANSRMGRHFADMVCGGEDPIDAHRMLVLPVN